MYKRRNKCLVTPVLGARRFWIWGSWALGDLGGPNSALFDGSSSKKESEEPVTIDWRKREIFVANDWSFRKSRLFMKKIIVIIGPPTSKEFLLSPTLNPQICLILGWTLMVKSYAPSKEMLKKKKPAVTGVYQRDTKPTGRGRSWTTFWAINKVVSDNNPNIKWISTNPY